jgi:hypothetical protein
MRTDFLSVRKITWRPIAYLNPGRGTPAPIVTGCDAPMADAKAMVESIRRSGLFVLPLWLTVVFILACEPKSVRAQKQLSGTASRT